MRGTEQLTRMSSNSHNMFMAIKMRSLHEIWQLDRFMPETSVETRICKILRKT
jgi:hypothetical protein